VLTIETGSDVATSLAIEPSAPTVTVETGKPIATVNFILRNNGTTVDAKWMIDRAEIGTIGLQTGVFRPKANVCGLARITDTLGSDR
jgi:hypothetical protein